jgi:hypothetical protein
VERTFSPLPILIGLVVLIGIVAAVYLLVLR